MGRHSRPSHHRTRNALIVTAPIVGIPLTTGIAHPAELTGPPDGWEAVIKCESGGRPHAVNPRSTASGLLQILDGTWRAFGGRQFSRRAKDATPAEQMIIAERIYARSGLTPWNASRSCWRHRIGKTTPKRVPAPSARVYRVQPGDTLSEIAARTGHTWKDLLDANKATVSDPNLIHVGLSINLL